MRVSKRDIVKLMDDLGQEFALEPASTRRQLLEEALKGPQVARMLERLGIAPDDQPKVRSWLVDGILARAEHIAASKSKNPR